jgi:hypothetical protein
MIAATPRSWERGQPILQAVPDRRLRNMMVAGTVGEAIAAEFALIADDIAATVRVAEMLERRRRRAGRCIRAPCTGCTRWPMA